MAGNDIGIALDHLLDGAGVTVQRAQIADAVGCPANRLAAGAAGSEPLPLARALVIAALCDRLVEEQHPAAAAEARRSAASIRAAKCWHVAPMARPRRAPHPGASLDERWRAVRALEGAAPGACAVLGQLVYLAVKYGGAFRVDAMHVASTLHLQWRATRVALDALANRGLIEVLERGDGTCTVYVVRIPWASLAPQRPELTEARLG